MTAYEILQYFRERQPVIVEAVREVVEIESPSYDVERSREVVAWVEAAARSIPLEMTIEKIAAANYGEHMLVRAFPGEAKQAMLLGHTDTVHPVGTKIQNPTRIEDGKLYGCGVFDMKAGVVLMLETLRFFAATGISPARPITILLSCDEEVGSFTGRSIVEAEARRSEFCLVCEPSAAGRVKTGRKGTGTFTIKAHGRPAHAGLEPEKGASAILELSRQIDKLAALNDPASGTTANVCTIKGGTTTNVIPEHAECTLDVRFTSVKEAERIEREVEAMSSVDERVSLTILGGINRHPLERTEAVAALYGRAKELAEGFGYELGETQVGGGSDGNFVGALGVPVLDGLGVTGDGAHTLYEHILVDDIAARATLITMLLM
jgi:glutamate carboxypeptidase